MLYLGESGGASASLTPINGRDTEARPFLQGGAEPGRTTQEEPLIVIHIFNVL